MLTPEIRAAVLKALEKNVPFALIALPNENEAMFRIGVSRPEWHSNEPKGIGFVLNMFGNDEFATPFVPFDSNESLILENDTPDALPGPSVRALTESTDRLTYLSQVHKLVRSLRMGEMEKVVLSRVVVELSRGAESLVDVANEYFKLLPTAFRYLAFTPQTGVWLGATPELVAEYLPESDTLHTCSMAGTLPTESRADWDIKNLLEQKMVTRYLVERLHELKARIKGGANRVETCEIVHGPVKHLFTPIEARLSRKNFPGPRELMYAIAPTPAVCGLPREQAMAEILTTETHDRLCYGGCVGLVDTESGMMLVYANLRCALAERTREGWLYNLYVGGGLTPLSNPHDEWQETENKSRALREIINRYA